jgi:hypothetical protein
MEYRRPADVRPRSLAYAFLILAMAALGCREPTTPTVDIVAARGARGSTDPVVQSVVPDDAPRNFTLDITVKGSGFDDGSTVQLEQDEHPVPGVTTNSTTFISSSQLRANLTIDAGVVPDRYDVAVITSGGKRGIGVERFEVLEVIWLGPLDGERLFMATRINSTGQVTGWSATTPFFWSPESGAEWIWKERTWWAYPMAINDAGQVAGYTCGRAPSDGGCSDYAHMYGMVWTRTGGSWSAVQVTEPGNLVTDLTNDGELFYSEYLGESGWRSWRRAPDQPAVPLPVPSGGSPAVAVFANNTGQAVSGTLFWWFDANRADVLVLPLPNGAAGAIAADIADRAGSEVFVVGSGSYGGFSYPVRWTLEATSTGWSVTLVERLPIPPKTKPYGYGYGRGVNSAGDAVGFYYDSRGTGVPIKWSRSGGYSILPRPRSAANAEAFTINNLGWVAGYMEAPYQGAVVWRP